MNEDLIQELKNFFEKNKNVKQVLYTIDGSIYLVSTVESAKQHIALNMQSFNEDERKLMICNSDMETTEYSPELIINDEVSASKPKSKKK